jgi:2-amino-4-hydroxy-6-hydroxymethyldihydropteridine diphosphokinase
LSAVKSKEIHQVVIGFGSNISPAENLKSSLYLLGRLVPIEAVSSVWHTPAVSSPGPEFLNAAVLISTQLPIAELRNEILHPIENLLGRVRTKDPNAPRTIDLDILIYDGQMLDQELWKYAHMGVPVAELLPTYTDPLSGDQAIVIAERLRKSSTIKKSSLELHRTGPTRNII